MLAFLAFREGRVFDRDDAKNFLERGKAQVQFFKCVVLHTAHSRGRRRVAN